MEPFVCRDLLRIHTYIRINYSMYTVHAAKEDDDRMLGAVLTFRDTELTGNHTART